MKRNWRPLKVLFVGDRPSTRNVDEKLAFVGTPSYKRILKWIGELDLDIKNVSLMNTAPCITVSEHQYDVVLFLGKKSETVVSVLRFGEHSYDWAEMPKTKVIDHPSPRNRKFNDQQYERVMLKKLKKWIYNEQRS